MDGVCASVDLSCWFNSTSVFGGFEVFTGLKSASEKSASKNNSWDSCESLVDVATVKYKFLDSDVPANAAGM